MASDLESDLEQEEEASTFRPCQEPSEAALDIDVAEACRAVAQCRRAA